MTLKWEEPKVTSAGPKGARQQHWEEIAKELREYPERWALVAEKPTPTTASSMASQARRGVYAAFRPVGCYEVIANGTYVYARYVGEVA